MALPAELLEWENPVDERIARLETKVDRLQSDMAEVKIDIRKLDEKIDTADQSLTRKIDAVDQKLTRVDEKLTQKIEAVDQKLTRVDEKLTQKIEAVDQKLTARIDAVKDSVSALALSTEQSFRAVDKSIAALQVNMEKSIGSLHVGRAFDRIWWLLMSGALLGIMARAFKWL